MKAVRPAGYLSTLAARLAAGTQFLPEAFRLRHAAYLLAAQRADGGFAGRRGESDIYYTMFGLRCGEMLALSDGGFWRSAAQHARSYSSPPKDLVECFCLLYNRRLIGGRGEAGIADARRRETLDVVRRARSATGGYARIPGGEATVYHTFLAALCAELGEEDFDRSRDAAEFLMSHRCDDGGFADSGEDDGAGGTNPTAAAVALLALLGALDSGAAAQSAAFFASMQQPEGGFGACAGAPQADLLSTFTATVALAGIGALDRVKVAPIARFVNALQAPGGGFRGSVADDAPDIEYTYYGLGTLALLAYAAERSPHNA